MGVRSARPTDGQNHRAARRVNALPLRPATSPCTSEMASHSSIGRVTGEDLVFEGGDGIFDEPPLGRTGWQVEGQAAGYDAITTSAAGSACSHGGERFPGEPHRAASGLNMGFVGSSLSGSSGIAPPRRREKQLHHPLYSAYVRGGPRMGPLATTPSAKPKGSFSSAAAHHPFGTCDAGTSSLADIRKSARLDRAYSAPHKFVIPLRPTNTHRSLGFPNCFP